VINILNVITAPEEKKICLETWRF